MNRDSSRQPSTILLDRQLRFYRNLSLVLGLVVVVLAGILILGRGPKFARAIKINDVFICLVNNHETAERVHDRALSNARGDLPGEASLEEQWEDVNWPVEDNEVLSFDKAVEAIAPRVTVVVEAAIIEVNGQRAAVMPTEELANDVLEALKAQYVGEGDTIIGQQVFLEDVKVCPGQAPVGEVTREIGQAVKQLGKTKSEAKTYTVRAGDFPEKIAAAHGMSMSDLWELNPSLRGSTIHPGDVLKVASPTAGITVKTVKEVTREVELELKVEKVHSGSVARGESRVATEGSPPRKLLREWHTFHNDTLRDQEVKSGQIIDPGTPRRVLIGTGDRPAVGAGGSN